MDIIDIEPSQKTPRVLFDKSQGILTIEGKSIPENSTEFYKPIYDWLDNYVLDPNQETNFKFNLVYFNTSSSKCILDILRKLEKLLEGENQVKVTWCYEEDDEDMMEAGEDYQGIVKVPITLELVEG